MQSVTFTFTGVAPLCFHNERLANPTDPFTIALRKLTSIRGKTDETLLEIQKLEWRAGFYDDERGIPLVTADCVLATVLNGAKKAKLGPKFKAGVWALDEAWPLIYKGPKLIEDLWADGKFLDYRGVVVNRARCMRARPMFREWSLKPTLVFDPDIIDRSQVVQSAEQAGRLIGLCERRPRWGRFEVSV